MVRYTYVCIIIDVVMFESALEAMHDYVLSAPMFFFVFNWNLCFHIYKYMFHLIRKRIVFYVWGCCILYVNHVAEALE